MQLFSGSMSGLSQILTDLRTGETKNSICFCMVGGIRIDVALDFCNILKKATFSDENSDFFAVADSKTYFFQEADVYVHIAPVPVGDFDMALGEKIFSQQRISLYKAREGYVQIFCLDDDNKKPLWILAADSDFSRFDYAFCPHNFNGSEEPPAIDLRNLAFSLFLLQHSVINHQGLIIHAAGGSVLNRGMVFAAPSGTGKSTLSQLLQSPQNRLFSEERLIIRSLHEKWHVWGTPWHGEGNIARNESAPLSALIFLRQSQETKITRLSPPDGLHRLIQTVSIPWYSEEWTDKGLALCESLIQDVPMFELAFRPDQSAVQAVERLAVTL